MTTVRLFAALAVSSTCSLAAVACGGGAYGAAPAQLAEARSRAAAGADVYQKECARCHGERGEGAAGRPSIIGDSALPRYARDPSMSNDPTMTDPQRAEARRLSSTPGAPPRPQFRTALDLFRYVSRNMPQPESRAGSLTEQQYWEVVTFMLIAHGVQVPEGGIDQSNAASVVVNP